MIPVIEKASVFEIKAHKTKYRIAAQKESRVGTKLGGGVPYEHALLEHIYEQKFKGAAVDVGAHIGNHSLWFAAVCKLSVQAFEPIHWDDLSANITRNPDLLIMTHPVALGREDGHARDVGKNVLELGEGSILVRPLDAYSALGDISVIKIDVEGMEPEVLLGAEATIMRNRPVIFAEAQDEAARTAQRLILEPWGYKVNDLWNPNLVSTPVLRWDP